MSKILKDNDGFTMMEFVVALAIMGVLMSIAIPSYNNVAEKTQAARNLANMEVIREVFFSVLLQDSSTKRSICSFSTSSFK